MVFLLWTSLADCVIIVVIVRLIGLPFSIGFYFDVCWPCAVVAGWFLALVSTELRDLWLLVGLGTATIETLLVVFTASN